MAKELYIEEIDTNGEVVQTDRKKLSDVAAEVREAIGVTGTTKRMFQFTAQVFEWFSGTYNGIVCSATGATTILYENWVFKPFDKTMEEAIQVDFCLPDNYVNGADIVVMLETGADTDNKVSRFGVGLRKKTGTGKYGQDADAEYVVQNINTGSGAGWEPTCTTYTFDGSTFVKGEQLCVVVYRDAAKPADNLNGDAYIRLLTIDQA